MQASGTSRHGPTGLNGLHVHCGVLVLECNAPKGAFFQDKATRCLKQCGHMAPFFQDKEILSAHFFQISDAYLAKLAANIGAFFPDKESGKCT